MNEATRRQIAAANPARSTWLTANAGSGKTRVVTDRVARLLLDGTAPENILCLTYTKAAASEMQNRLFERLGQWVFLPDEKLREELVKLGESPNLPEDALRFARTLFARAIETPGGLKIQTIHAFCAGLLRRFPVEAAVSPHFEEIDETAQTAVIRTVLDQMAEHDENGAFASIISLTSESDLPNVIKAILTHSEAILTKDVTLPHHPRDAILADALHLSDADIVAQLIELCEAGKPTDKKLRGQLLAIDMNMFASWQTFAILKDAFLLKSGTPPRSKAGKLPTKAIRDAHPELAEEADDLMERVAAANDALLAEDLARKTEKLHLFAREFLARYAEQKMVHQYLDFDDLISKAAHLLTKPGISDWVLYKLDGGIDHILVDEAQDTSPAQWQVIQTLAEEFAIANESDGKRHSLFVVGDKKQSIYSFQGADPRGFDIMAEHFDARFRSYQSPFGVAQLQHSFRSSAAVLNVVDQVFVGEAAQGLEAHVAHTAFFEQFPGRVDLWQVEEAPEKPEDTPWYSPVDQIAPNHESRTLAEHIAKQIKELLASGTLPADAKNPEAFRPVEPGDILILVQRRTSQLFSELMRALKAEELPIAGADRLNLLDSLAVQDVYSLLKFLVLPENDLALAEALKSPIFGWDEARLFDLAHKRVKMPLWQKLRQNAERYPSEHAILKDLRDHTDFIRPYDLIQRILLRHGALEAFRARLGAEVNDALEALLSEALKYESEAVPDLNGFVEWLGQSETEVKRQIETDGNLIRIMTVHGAKGLESPIVILPDTTKRNKSSLPPLLPSEFGVLLTPRADAMPSLFLPIEEAYRDREAEENRRLFYVAMTRAESWLIIAGAGKAGEGLESWHALAEQGLNASDAQPEVFANGQGLRYQFGAWGAANTARKQTSERSMASAFAKPLPPKPEPQKLITPSRLEGESDYAEGGGLPRELALAKGELVHKLLEVSSSGADSDTFDRILTSYSERLPEAIRAGALKTATEILAAPEFAQIFGENGFSEVDISATLPKADHTRIDGIIDRLVIKPEEVCIYDFKTNAQPPEQIADCPKLYLRQLGAYASAIETLYPDKPIRVFLLWTETRNLMEIPTATAKAAFHEIL